MNEADVIVSGAIQHLAGRSGSKFAAAVNKAPEAFFFKVIPHIIDELKKLKG